MTERDDRYRDEGLGVALAELDAPEHAPTFFAELEAALAVTPPRRSRRRLWLPPGVAVAAAVVAILVAVAFPRLGETEAARASDVAARISDALAETTGVRGRIAYSFDGETTRHWFTVDSVGNLRLTDADGATDLAFDARRGVERAITTSASMGTGRFYAERTGLAPGPPDPTRTDFVLAREVGAVARALTAAGDERARTGRVDGRDVWLLDVAVTPNTLYADVDRITAAVDQATGFPLRVRTTLGGEPRSELRLEELILDSEAPAGAFDLRFPRGAEVLRTDAGFANVSLAEARRIAGYEPLVPSWLPDGFARTTVATSERGVVSVAYHRGLEQVTVTTRPRGAGTPRDPFAVAGVAVRQERVEVAGRQAELVVDPRIVPHVWWTQRGLVVTVAGDLTRNELLAAAASVRSPG